MSTAGVALAAAVERASPGGEADPTSIAGVPGANSIAADALSIVRTATGRTRAAAGSAPVP